MNKKVILTVLCVVAAILITACNSPKQDPQKSQLPSGVCERNSKNYYVIKLPDGHNVSEYFSLTGSRGTIVDEVLDFEGESTYIGVAYNSAVAEGGWVAYSESGTGVIIYIPEYYSVNDVKFICGELASDPNPNNYMTLEEAKEYIPWIKNRKN